MHAFFFEASRTEELGNPTWMGFSNSIVPYMVVQAAAAWSPMPTPSTRRTWSSADTTARQVHHATPPVSA